MEEVTNWSVEEISILDEEVRTKPFRLDNASQQIIWLEIYDAALDVFIELMVDANSTAPVELVVAERFVASVPPGQTSNYTFLTGYLNVSIQTIGTASGVITIIYEITGIDGPIIGMHLPESILMVIAGFHNTHNLKASKALGSLEADRCCVIVEEPIEGAA